MDRIFGLLIHSNSQTEKQVELAAIILENLNSYPGSLEVFRKFEKQLVISSFNDENITSITTEILFNLSGRNEG